MSCPCDTFHVQLRKLLLWAKIGTGLV
ncbi:hypothetical protein P5673_019807 [Acropora cervicornis]|uniref:Uncharacterized protein n=1 Tax=Acropora cervicornis TaxID=6130 RepID=A0AAD9QAT7_ACRCE|nr:hypothetical protein P5673_019807 [Acropora cervicornis]